MEKEGRVRQKAADGDRVLGIQADVLRAPALAKMENMVQEVRIKVTAYNRPADVGAGAV